MEPTPWPGSVGRIRGSEPCLVSPSQWWKWFCDTRAPLLCPTDPAASPQKNPAAAAHLQALQGQPPWAQLQAEPSLSGSRRAVNSSQPRCRSRTTWMATAMPPPRNKAVTGHQKPSWRESSKVQHACLKAACHLCSHVGDRTRTGEEGHTSGDRACPTGVTSSPQKAWEKRLLKHSALRGLFA